MNRRPNPSLDEIARGPKTDQGECEAWLVARSVEEDRVRIDALEGHWRWLQQCMEADDARIKRLESPPDRATGELADAVAMVELTRRDLADARRERDEVAESYLTACRARDRRIVEVRELVDQRDALQQQLADCRSALARIAEYQADPGRSFHQDYVNVKGIAKDALATATPETEGAV